jgi:hypothetical protein
MVALLRTTNIQEPSSSSVNLSLNSNGTSTFNSTVYASNGTSSNQVVNYSQFPFSTGTTGYTKLPNGIIIQSGAYTFTYNTSSQDTWYYQGFTVNFPTSFPNACIGVNASGNPNGGGIQMAVVGSIGTSSFTFEFDSSGQDTNQSFTIWYIAFGY